jgi:hypothetical protein
MEEDGIMKKAFSTFLLISLLSCCVTAVLAQNKKSAADVVQDLKFELIDLNAHEAELKLQVQQLDESLKPENIANSLAGIGSTRPEELREQRKRQLTIQRSAVSAKLEQVALRRTQVEAALVTAENQVYQDSAKDSSLIENALAVTPGGLRTLAAAGLLLVGLLISVLILLRYSRKERSIH